MSDYVPGGKPQATVLREAAMYGWIGVGWIFVVQIALFQNAVCLKESVEGSLGVEIGKVNGGEKGFPGALPPGVSAFTRK